jgi:hypothetical protein
MLRHASEGTIYMPIDPIRPVQPLTTTASSPGPTVPRRGRTVRADLQDVPVVLNPAANGRTPKLTVIVPTRDEKRTIGLLLVRLSRR